MFTKKTINLLYTIVTVKIGMSWIKKHNKYRKLFLD